MTDQTTTLEKIETQSSIFEKTDPDLRRRLDQAIIDHDPPTYKAIFSKFELGGRGISFMAFYRYARRLRTHAVMIELTQRVLPDDCDPVGVIPNLLAHRLLDAAVDESTSPRTLQRLTDAWRFAAQTQLVLQRHQAAIKKIKNSTDEEETQGLIKIVKQVTTMMLTERVALLEAQQYTAESLQSPDADYSPNADTTPDADAPP